MSIWLQRMGLQWQSQIIFLGGPMCKSIDFFFSFSQKLQGGGGIYSKPKGGPSPPSTPPPSTSEWVGRVENQQGSDVFSPNPPKFYLSKLERKQTGEKQLQSMTKLPSPPLMCQTCYWVFFFFANILLGVIRYNFFRFCGCFLLFCSSSFLFIYLFFGLTGHDFFFYTFFFGA